MTKKEKIHWWPILGLAVTLLFALIAELYRIKGILILDLWIPLFTWTSIGWWALTGSLTDRIKKLPTSLVAASAATILFLGIGSVSLLLNSTEMSMGELARSGFYSFRWMNFFLFGLLFTQTNSRTQNILLWMMFGFATLLSIAGFVQLQIQPDFDEDMTTLGWDPHKGRLLSTWFDPNFVGGFLAFTLAMMTDAFLTHKKWRLPLLPLAGICAAALVLTLSRSSYLALIAGVGIIALVRARWLIPLGVLGVMLLLAVSSSTRERVEDLVDTVTTLASPHETYLLPDPSARERFGKWEEGYLLFKDAPLMGQGYNRYQNAALELGTLKDASEHDSTGTDSSLLTILSLTGILGFAAYIAIHAFAGLYAWHNKNLGWLAGLIGLLIHSQFVNSMLFPMILMSLWLYLCIKYQAPDISLRHLK